MSRLLHHKKPCATCPWRRDATPGHFSAARYRALANTAYDMSMTLFACHDSTDESPVTCAGFLMRGATHNLSVRMAYSFDDLAPGDVSDGGHALYDSYREMAVANGVAVNDAALRDCRDN